MLSISFYRPEDYFSGFFNRFVTWLTAGDFCHCELVVHTTPKDIMDTVKHIYLDAQKSGYAPEDCTRILHQIESNFFSTEFKKIAQSSEQIVLSFSLLWGSPMSVRVLNTVSHDSWFQIPDKSTKNVVMKTIDTNPEQTMQSLKFAIEELGKNYDTTGALCSWIPYKSQPSSSYESYFCSEFVVMTFQRLEKMTELSALHTTPNTLYQYVSEHC